jgi:hypothetical protein
MKQVVDEVLQAEGPVFCEIFTDTEQVWEPKSSTKRLEDGTLVSPPLEDLAPFLPREELEQNMFIPLIILFFLLLPLFGWISWRWCWGWLGWLIPSTLLIWILIFVTGLQRNWDSSFYFLCVLRQLIGEISGQVEVIRYPSLAAGGIQLG